MSGATAAEAAGADLLIVGGTVVTMNPTRELLHGAAIAIRGDVVADIGAIAGLRARFPGVREIDARGCVVTPGLVNAHQHLSGDRFMRSAIPDNTPSGEAIFGWVQPMHAAHSPADDELSAVLTCMESVANGVTTVVAAGTEAYPDNIAAGMRAVGIRGVVGTWGWDELSGPFKQSTEEVLEIQRKVVESLRDDRLLSGWVTLIGHNLVSDDLFIRGSELARELGVGLSFHMSPTESDVAAFRARSGERPLVHLRRLGVLGPHVLVGHAVHIDDDEVAALVDSNAAVAYCPWAYLRLGQGVTRAGRHAELLRLGVRVALGCDSDNAGDSLDILRAAALSAGIAKDMAGDPAELGAHGAFEMATIGGAHAIGLGAVIGSIEVGKAADLVVHECTGPQWNPRAKDVVQQLVWASDGRSVRDVIVAGRPVLRDRVFVNVDAASVYAQVAIAAEAVQAKAGIRAPSRWPEHSFD